MLLHILLFIYFFLFIIPTAPEVNFGRASFSGNPSPRDSVCVVSARVYLCAYMVVRLLVLWAECAFVRYFFDRVKLTHSLSPHTHLPPYTFTFLSLNRRLVSTARKHQQWQRLP